MAEDGSVAIVAIIVVVVVLIAGFGFMYYNGSFGTKFVRAGDTTIIQPTKETIRENNTTIIRETDNDGRPIIINNPPAEVNVNPQTNVVVNNTIINSGNRS